MSADSVVDCPECGEQELREYFECGFPYEKEPNSMFLVDYSARCRLCGVEYEYHRTIPANLIKVVRNV